jgi:hypothetical protein
VVFLGLEPRSWGGVSVVKWDSKREDKNKSIINARKGKSVFRIWIRINQ